MLDGNSPSNITRPKGECSQMTYEERVEQAIAANDIETLVKFTYGYTHGSAAALARSAGRYAGAFYGVSTAATAASFLRRKGSVNGAS